MGRIFRMGRIPHILFLSSLYPWFSWNLWTGTNLTPALRWGIIFEGYVTNL